jgi:hypothetical protein
MAVSLSTFALLCVRIGYRPGLVYDPNMRRGVKLFWILI